jgi:hypothetical protein
MSILVTKAMIKACQEAITEINGPRELDPELYDELALARTARHQMILDYTPDTLVVADVYYLYYAFKHDSGEGPIELE